MTLSSAKAALKRHADPQKAAVHRGYFKHSETGLFLGVTAALMRQIAGEHEELGLSDIRKLMPSRIFDERSLANGILVRKFERADEAGQGRLYHFYMKNRRFIRDWAGVDGSAPYIVGAYLFDRDKAVLYELVRSERIWDRRIALVSTLTLIRKGRIADTLKLVEKVLGDREDLIHKAAGWMLREVGKKKPDALKAFLKKHHSRMPRTMLRYAIERFSKAERGRYLKGEF